MDIILAIALGELNRGKELMVFDWDKAAGLIKERKPKYAFAGLESDWEWTGGAIFFNGKPVMDDYTFLSSTWAVPQLSIDGDIMDCFLMESQTKWDSKTKWPQSALDILNGDDHNA